MENIILDFSGTVADDRQRVFQTMNRTLESYGKQGINFATWKTVMSMDFKTMWSNLGVNAPLDEIVRKYKELYSNGPKVEPIPGNFEAIKTLSTFYGVSSLSVLSACPQKQLEEHLEELKLLRYFGGVFGNQTKKEETLKIFGVGSSLFAGDMESDAIAANLAGVDFVAIDNSYAYHNKERLAKHNPRYIINHLNEILNIAQNER